jgi:uncharacterized protein with GYD domain
MPKFLLLGQFTSQGAKALVGVGGSNRRDAVRKAVESVGGKVEAFYFAFGKHDTYTVMDLPDNESAAAVSLAVGASGAVAVQTVVLLTPEEVDTAVKRSVDYRPPGS